MALFANLLPCNGASAVEGQTVRDEQAACRVAFDPNAFGAHHT